ncbi:MAG: hypothetical protein IT384_28820 [Deltaproteobacteria bacterium]|nr:hypothetical protein [Deltaproteobacteria bacterium]
MHRRALVPLISLGLWLGGGAAPARAAGVAARFQSFPAVEGRPLDARLEIEDETGAVERVEVELRSEGGVAWHTMTASRTTALEWQVRFPVELIPRAGQKVELRAVLLGARGGLLLELGADEPFALEVKSPAHARAEARLLTRAGEEEAGFALIGYVGADARAGSSARARAAIAIGLALGGTEELLATVSVGPAFARPALLESGGPLVLGVELALRGYVRAPSQTRWAPFGEVLASADLRLPGFDPGGGLRAGISYGLGTDTRVELSVGGAAVVFGAAGEPSAAFGVAGGVRLMLRFESPGRESPR